MNTVKQALTRKLGPLPAWAWFVLGGGALWWYRRRTAGTATQQAGQPDLASVGPYGQDWYPIQGNGGGAGATTTGASTGKAPTINVYGLKPTKRPPKRRRVKQHKAQHRKQTHKHPRSPKHAAHKPRPRSHAAVHHSSANHKRAAGHQRRVTRTR